MSFIDMSFIQTKIYNECMNALKYQEVIMSNLFPFIIDKFGESECILHHDVVCTMYECLNHKKMNKFFFFVASQKIKFEQI